MKYLCLITLLLMFSIGFTQDDPMHTTFKPDEDYTLKLTVLNIQRGFEYNNAPYILKRIADEYREEGRIYTRKECKTLIENTIQLKKDQEDSTSANPNVQFHINEISHKGGKATVNIEMCVYLPNGEEIAKYSEVCTLELVRFGGGWQINKSNGFFTKLGGVLKDYELGNQPISENQNSF